MIGFVNGEKLLTESDLPPRWNILTGTKDFSGKWSNATDGDGKLTDLKDHYGNYFVRHDNVAWQGTNQNAMVSGNQIYTFSLIFKNESKNVKHLRMYASGYSSTTDIQINSVYIDKVKTSFIDEGQSISAPTDDTEHELSYVININKSGIINLRIESMEDASYLISSFKLEHGSTATPWMPAISDLMLKNQNGGVRATKSLVSMFYVPSLEMEAA